MIVNKHHVTDYIKCPYLFAKSVLSSKYNSSKMSAEHVNFKTHVTEIASYEMKNACKLELYEYRIQYTNKYYSGDATEVLGAGAMDNIVPKLNNLLSVFSDNAFFGYNIPVEIAVPGTNAVYKDTVSFGLIDDNKSITLVEIDDLSDKDRYIQMLRNWVHYYITYSYLAHAFDKKVIVTILDPVLYDRYDIAFLPDRYEMDINRLAEMIKPIHDGLLYKNLFACSTCGLVGDCK